MVDVKVKYNSKLVATVITFPYMKDDSKLIIPDGMVLDEWIADFPSYLEQEVRGDCNVLFEGTAADFEVLKKVIIDFTGEYQIKCKHITPSEVSNRINDKFSKRHPKPMQNSAVNVLIRNSGRNIAHPKPVVRAEPNFQAVTSFEMIVEDVVEIDTTSSSSLVALGSIQTGSVRTQDTVIIVEEGNENEQEAVVAGIEMLGEIYSYAESGDKAGLILSNVKAGEVKPGSIIIKKCRN